MVYRKGDLRDLILKSGHFGFVWPNYSKRIYTELIFYFVSQMTSSILFSSFFSFSSLVSYTVIFFHSDGSNSTCDVTLLIYFLKCYWDEFALFVNKRCYIFVHVFALFIKITFPELLIPFQMQK